METKAKILLVDDDVDIQRLLITRLRKVGYEIISATDGVGCMMQARREHPDLVILDLGIPGGDGFTSLQRLRGSTSFAAMPIIVLTGNDGDGIEERALELGASGFVNKGDGTAALLTAVERALSGEEEVASKDGEIELTVMAGNA